jgi:hypothetical protein
MLALVNQAQTCVDQIQFINEYFEFEDAKSLAA